MKTGDTPFSLAQDQPLNGIIVLVHQLQNLELNVLIVLSVVYWRNCVTCYFSYNGSI